MKNKDALYKQHILDAIMRIKKYTTLASYDEFISNEMMYSAVIRELEIIGEAAKQMSEEGRVHIKGIPWPSIISTRNRLIHEYFGVDLETVWHTVQYDLDVLEQKINQS
ncbi:MAG: DUF86 domain-containing protein [Candidatus Magasanikbacteria bacterium]|nr:DUF86 domain-containing protein [Candidatus Magasanikbacteria bacterium]